jgi:hypothetical protein
MRKKLYSVEVKGNWYRWSFDLWAYPKDAEDWEKDGLNVKEIVNTIPEWWPFSVGFWCSIEDLFDMLRLW